MSAERRSPAASDAYRVSRLAEQYRELREELEAIAKHVTRDRGRDEAMDVVQKVFLRLLERMRSGQDLEVGAGYLRRAVRLSALDRDRDRAKREDPAWRSALADEWPPVPRPWRILVAERRRDLIAELLGELASGQARVIDLVDLKGLSYAAAAERIGTSKENVKKQLARGRRALRAILEARGRASGDEV